MSVTAISARVDEIQQMISSLQTGSVGAEGSENFAAALQSATTAGGQGDATQTGTPGATPLTPVAGAATGTGAATGPLNTPYAAEIQAAAQKHGVDPALLTALVRQESNFNPTAGSPAGARGLTQLMPGTAASLGVTDVNDPVQALDGGAKYLKQQLDAFNGDERLALAAYNAGPGAVQKFGGIPPYAETQNYVKKVLAYAEEYRAAAAPAPAALPPTSTLPSTAAAIGAGVPTTSMSTPTSSSPSGGLPYSTT
ncbi:lytic transglycosylase domain-containing protein [Svornostia abyssi]|uniref:lytic transglycosylase domain-containing protein n=1 Tax=Svornostia abyssi TaxID=2898438 RepID=UPI003390620A